MVQRAYASLIGSWLLFACGGSSSASGNGTGGTHTANGGGSGEQGITSGSSAGGAATSGSSAGGSSAGGAATSGSSAGGSSVGGAATSAGNLNMNGGAGSAGASGSAGVSAAGGGGAGGSVNDVCPSGDQMIHDTSYGPATTLRVCVVSTTDYKIRYHVTTPAAPASGGYVVVSFRQVDPKLDVNVQIVPALRPFALDTLQSAPSVGADFDTWFAAVAGAEFFIDVTNVFGSSIAADQYLISATFVPVSDGYEPNDEVSDAKPILPNTAIQAYAFAGYGAAPSIFDDRWYDWYKVTLKAGKPSIELKGAPVNFSVQVSLDDPNSSSGYAATGETLSAGSVTISPAQPIAAGEYDVIILPSSSFIDAYGRGATPAPYVTQPYTLTVTE